MKEFLDSDRVNFLIWRYLLEGNYPETAAKFQKEWHIREPHREFDFAPHVKNNALVSVINKGLVYHSLERQRRQNQAGVFGPLTAQKYEDANSVDIDAGDPQQRKRQIDPRTQAHVGHLNGSPAKKPRLSNGYENRADSATTPMDVDLGGSGDNNHAYPSPLEGEQAPTPIPRTDGPEQGTQVDQVQDLAPETTFLRLTSDEFLLDNGLLAPSETANGTGENTPILLHCEWNPTDTTILAAAGTDALARMWTIPGATAAEPAPNHVNGINRPFRSLLDSDSPRSVNVSALAWNESGTAIALATEHGNKARINIWAKDGSHLHQYTVSESPVIKLRWNSSEKSALLSISPDRGNALVTVYRSGTHNTSSHTIKDHDLNSWPLDAVWIDTDILLCGGDLLLWLRWTEEAGLVELQRFPTRPDDNFIHVLYDWRSRIAATSSDKGVLDLWNENLERRSISAHAGAITAVQWQPLQTNAPEEVRLIASGGDDAAILIWNARMPHAKPKCFMTMDSSIVAIAFTPDGAFIAGATSNQVLVWKVGDHAVPRARWSRTPHPGWRSPRANSEEVEEDEHCVLCWDAGGTRLAYGANSRLAVINVASSIKR